MSAPEKPKTATTSLLHTGQPTAKAESSPPPAPDDNSLRRTDPRGSAKVAGSAPTATLVSGQRIASVTRTGVIRVNHGFGKTSVGMPIKSAASVVVTGRASR